MVVAKQMCAYAASVGSRAGTGKGNNLAAVQSAAEAAAPMLKLADSNVTVAVTDSLGHAVTFNATTDSRARGDTVTVTVTYTFTPVAPGFTKLVTKNYSVKSSEIIP